MDQKDAHKGRTLLVSPKALVLALFLVAPLAIGLVWGTFFDDDSYTAFCYARNLAAGRGLICDSPPSDPPVSPELRPSLRSPFYALVLWLPAKLGMSLSQASLIVSALGWGATALAIYGLCRAISRPVAAIVSASLVAFSPAFIPLLGTEIPWVVAFAWIAVALSMSERWALQTGAMVAVVLMLCVRLEPSTLAAAALLLIARWIKRQSFPLAPSLILAVVVLIWRALAASGSISFLSPPHLNPVEWLGIIERLFDESEFYWVFLPAIGVGLFSIRASSKALWIGLLGAAVVLLSDDAIAVAMMAALGLLLAGLGIDFASRAVLERVEIRGVRLRRLAFVTAVVLVAASPLVITQVSSLVHRHRLRPIFQQALERQVGDWLDAHSEPTATLLSSARVGFLANRSTLLWNGDASDAAEFAALTETLAKSPTDYCVSHRSLYWDRLTHTGLFQDDYTPLIEVASPYDAVSPFTIWRYVHAAKPQPVEATFGDQIGLLSFGAADSLTMGESLEVRLYWKALRPLEEDYIVFVHVLSADGELVANHDGPPRGGECPTSTWLPGDVVPDVHYVELDPQTPAGIYQLWVGLYTWPGIERLPVRNREGVEQANMILFLHSVEVCAEDD